MENWVPLIPKAAGCAFFAILFLQSGLDKVFDYKGNLAYFTDHFTKSHLKGALGLMMPMITLLEVAAGAVCAVGLVMLFVGGGVVFARAGIGLACLSLLCLFFGQRMAKDYAGAATLAIYMGVGILALTVVG